jgi:hypothetical protein
MPSIQDLNYKTLQFDRFNPRLPESLRGADTGRLAKYYYDQSVVTDLVQSMAENGFFPHEPMIVKPDGDGTYTVLEGNRRLTALCIIHRRPEAADLPQPDPALTFDQVDRLGEVPCVISEDLEAIRRFIGFRHISGPLTWEPEAKARFLAEEVEKAVAAGNEQPFHFVAHAFGSKPPAVRGYYTAVRLLRLARDEAGFDVSQIQSTRFGVWHRLMSSPDFRNYIGVADAPTFKELDAMYSKVDLSRLREVLSDLRATDGVPVLQDSRDATNYGRVLMNAGARETLRKTGDLEAAKTIIDRQRLPDRIRGQARKIDALSSEVKLSEYSQETEEAAKHLAASAAALRKLAAPTMEDELF